MEFEPRHTETCRPVIATLDADLVSKYEVAQKKIREKKDGQERLVGAGVPTGFATQCTHSVQWEAINICLRSTRWHKGGQILIASDCTPFSCFCSRMVPSGSAWRETP